MFAESPPCHKRQVTAPSLCVAPALFTLVIIHLICDNQLQINSNFIQFSWFTFTDNYNLYCSGLDSWIMSNLATGSFLRQPVVNLLSTFKSAIFHQTFSVFVRSLLLGSRTSKNPRSKIRHDCPVHAPKNYALLPDGPFERKRSISGKSEKVHESIKRTIALKWQALLTKGYQRLRHRHIALVRLNCSSQTWTIQRLRWYLQHF